MDGRVVTLSRDGPNRTFANGCDAAVPLRSCGHSVRWIALSRIPQSEYWPQSVAVLGAYSEVALPVPMLAVFSRTAELTLIETFEVLGSGGAVGKIRSDQIAEL